MTSGSVLPSLGSGVDWPDAAASAAVDAVLTGAAGRLGELAHWLAGVQGSARPAAPANARAVLLGGAAPSAVAARTADLHGIALSRADLPPSVADALVAGAALADAAADEGRDLLVLAGGEDPRDAAAVAVSLITGAEPVSLLPRGAAAVDTRVWIARAEGLRDRLRGLTRLRESPDELLLTLRSAPFAFACGALMRSAARRTPVLIDGTLVAAAAVLCYDVQARSAQWWRLADASPDPVHRRAAEDLAHRPVLDLGLQRDDGLAGLLAVGVIQAAAAVAGEGDA